MMIRARRQALDHFYAQLALAAQRADVLTPRRDLPIEWHGPGCTRFLSASSLAVQSLIPEGALHRRLIHVGAQLRTMFPVLSTHAFWQPPGTLHLNLAILERLRCCSQLNDPHRLDQAASAMDALEHTPSYRVDFRGVLITQDGTILAMGYPRDATPWAIRQRFIDCGFADQQKMFHITLARVLEPLTAPQWRVIREGICTHLGACAFGELQVQDAMLIDESEGFLHSPQVYRCLRQFHFDAGGGRSRMRAVTRTRLG